ncbi:MAG: hypothetical protein WD269_01560 [Acidimicrobiia bacterium]
MNRREIELVTALAEGRLEDETEARALIEANPGLRAAYEAQRRAIEALSQLPIPGMSHAERTALHRDVWTALTTENIGGRSVAPRRAGLTWGYAAAALLVVVGVVAALGRFTGSEQQGLSGIAAEAVDQGSDELTEDGAEQTTMVAAAPAAEDTADFLAGYADQARAGTLSYTASRLMTDEETEAIERCVDRAGLSDRKIEGEIERDGKRFALVVPEGEPLKSDTDIVFVDLETCQIAYRDR